MSEGRPTDASSEAWDGQTGSIGYLAKMFPRISETFVLQEILALKARGIPVRIYSLLPPTRDARMHAEAEALLPEVIVLPQPGWGERGRFWHDLRESWRARPNATWRELLRALLPPSRRRWRRFLRGLALAAQLRHDRIAHVHAAWAHTPAGVAWVASRLSGTPWSMSAHAKDIFLTHPASLAKKVAAARFTLACTRTHRDRLLALAPPTRGAVPPEIELVYHGVDTERFAPVFPLLNSAGSGDAPLILSVGRLVPKKGFENLLAAAVQLKAQGLAFRIAIIGSGPLRPELERMIRARGLADCVTLQGMLVRDELQAAYRRAACMVLASRVTADGDRDGIPNTLMEAMACGVPVIASALPSIQELVTDDESGVLVPPESPQALASAIASLLLDPDRRRRLGTRGRERVCAHFDARPWGDRVAGHFTRACGVGRVLYLSADRGVPVRGSKGASVHVRALTLALQALGAGPRILTTRPGPADGPPAPVPVIARETSHAWESLASRLARIARGGRPLERAWLRLFDNVTLHRDARALARSWRPDVIYERYSLCAIAGSLLARRLRVPHVLEINAPLADEEALFRGLRMPGLARRLEAWLWRRADRLVVVSQALAEHAQHLGVAAERIVVLPNAADPEIFHPGCNGSGVRERFALDGDFVIGFSGTLKPWHGVQHAIRALARLVPDEPGARLLIVGDGPERERLVAMAEDCAVRDRVHFAGSVPHSEVGAFLAASDVLVAPYGPLENHWFSPLKVAEYRAVGRPVIASAIGQLSESPGESAGVILVAPGDEAALAKALLELARDPQRRTTLGRAAATAMPWTWRHVAQCVLREAEAARREIWGWSDAGCDA